MVPHFLALPDSVLIVCFQLWVCADGTVSKFKGDVQAYKVTYNPTESQVIAYPAQSLIVSNIKAKP